MPVLYFNWQMRLDMEKGMGIEKMGADEELAGC